MVHLNGFTVKIIPQRGDQDKVQKHGSNYVGLENNTEYKLFLGNDRNTEAMAEIHIEGENVGTFFIQAHNSIIIERPADSPRKFVFVSERDYRASQAGVIAGEFTNGLVRVVFYPKKEQVYTVKPSYFSPRSPRLLGSAETSSFSVRPASPRLLGSSETLSFSARPSSLSSSSFGPSSPRAKSLTNYSSGATILGDHSNQTFGTKRRYDDSEIDWNNKTEITIRLVVKQEYIVNKPYVSISGRNTFQTRIPPRI
jgi:hypothetical protein